MLPTIRLDDENYIEIFEKTRKMIPKVFPEWTDYNEHDPGITLLQLFSWLKEMQQFYLDQIGTDNYRMYLKLLGITQKKRKPAVSLLQVLNHGNEKVLLKGTKFKAGDTIFETLQTETIEDNHIVACMSFNDDGRAMYDDEMLNSGSAMNIPVFGSIPRVGDEFYLFFNKPFLPDQIHKIYIEILDEYEIRRNEFSSYYYPLADIELQYFTAEGFKKCEYVEDETQCFLKSGTWSFKILDEMKKQSKGYVLRFVLNRSEYDVVPLFKKISLNQFSIIQTDTRANYTIVTLGNDKKITVMDYLSDGGELGDGQHVCNIKILVEKDDHWEKTMDYDVVRADGNLSYRINNADSGDRVMVVCYNKELDMVKGFEVNGLPYQVYDINDRSLLYEGLELLIKEKNDGQYYLWKKVEDFHCSKPEDRHYVFLEDEGLLLFGDCERGMAPEGSVKFVRYITTKGVRGNIKKHKIDSTVDKRLALTVTNDYDISTGEEAENIEEAFERFKSFQNEIERCVTCEDYEKIVKQTPGLRIKKVKAYTNPETDRYDVDNESSAGFSSNSSVRQDINEIYVVVQPYSYQDKVRLSNAYYRNIYYLLEQKRMIGTKVNIVSPEYYGASVFVEVSIHPHYTDAKDTISGVISHYFEQVVCEFGSAIIYSDIFGRVDALSCVSEIKSFSIMVQGKNVVHTKNENIILPKNSLVYLKSLEFEITLADS